MREDMEWRRQTDTHQYVKGKTHTQELSTRVADTRAGWLSKGGRGRRVGKGGNVALMKKAAGVRARLTD